MLEYSISQWNILYSIIDCIVPHFSSTNLLYTSLEMYCIIDAARFVAERYMQKRHRNHKSKIKAFIFSGAPTYMIVFFSFLNMDLAYFLRFCFKIAV